MKTFFTAAIGVLAGVLLAGLIILLTAPPQGQAVTLAPLPTPVPWAVHVIGEVTAPGVVLLPPDSRVQDAIAAAGGALPSADLSSVNLAAFVEDGAQVSVPKQRPELSIGGDTQTNTRLVNINTANQAELEALPGIGPTTAERIVQYRAENGRFRSVDDLLNVPGISSSILERVLPLITVGP